VLHFPPVPGIQDGPRLITLPNDYTMGCMELIAPDALISPGLSDPNDGRIPPSSCKKKQIPVETNLPCDDELYIRTSLAPGDQFQSKYMLAIAVEIHLNETGACPVMVFLKKLAVVCV